MSHTTASIIAQLQQYTSGTFLAEFIDDFSIEVISGSDSYYIPQTNTIAISETCPDLLATFIHEHTHGQLWPIFHYDMLNAIEEAKITGEFDQLYEISRNFEISAVATEIFYLSQIPSDGSTGNALSTHGTNSEYISLTAAIQIWQEAQQQSGGDLAKLREAIISLVRQRISTDAGKSTADAYMHDHLPSTSPSDEGDDDSGTPPDEPAYDDYSCENDLSVGVKREVWYKNGAVVDERVTPLDNWDIEAYKVQVSEERYWFNGFHTRWTYDIYNMYGIVIRQEEVSTEVMLRAPSAPSMDQIFSVDVSEVDARSDHDASHFNSLPNEVDSSYVADVHAIEVQTAALIQTLATLANQKSILMEGLRTDHQTTQFIQAAAVV